jgi:NADPH:quinone reductase-like Zn-dependent oxidoreductase
MQAYVIHEHGGLEALRREQRPLPEPGPEEVRLRILAAGLNHLDLWVRRGVPGHRFPLPLIPGSDGCGRVEALGERVTGVALGEPYLIAPGYGCGRCELCRHGDEALCRDYQILGESRDGTCAAAIVVPAASLVPLPDGLAPEEAVALPLVLMTAWRMLVVRAGLRGGETVLVQAGGSGIGSMAIQIAVALGCRVITTVGSPEKAQRATALGAEEAILYREASVAAEVRRWTEKRGVDVVVEHTGEATWEDSLRCLARGGRLVTCGATTGAAAAIDLRVLFFKQLSLLGSTMGSANDLRAGLRLVAQGRIRPLVDRTLPLDDLAAGHQLLEERGVFGKVTLRGWEA